MYILKTCLLQLNEVHHFSTKVTIWGLAHANHGITKVILRFHIRKLYYWWKRLAYFHCCAVWFIVFYVTQVLP